MRRVTLILMLAWMAVPAALASQRINAERLEQMVLASRRKSDMEVAQHLYQMELTQRLNAKTIAALKAELPGPYSRLALTMLAQQAVFLPLPQSELPAKPMPTVPEQQAIYDRSVKYVVAALHRMPNLYARMDTIRYENMPVAERARSGFILPPEPIHPVSRSVETVFYRDGKELVKKRAGEEGPGNFGPVTMITYGEFGPIFSVIYGDLAKGKLIWSHWVEGENGVDAVFQFSVPKRASHYMVRFCCVRGRPYKGLTAYDGELRVDPATGTILRLTVVAKLKRAPLTEEGIMVRYKPVTLGGKQYYCPAKSVAVYRSPVRGGVPRFSGFGARTPVESGHMVPMETRMNTIVFDHYHLFRSQVKIVPYKKDFAVKKH